MTEKLEKLKICPLCGTVTDEGKLQILNTEVSEVNQQLLQKQKSAFYKGIGSIVCLIIGWFIFGLFLGFVAVGCGWTALKEGNTGTKILGFVGLIGGALYILISCGQVFYY